MVEATQGAKIITVGSSETGQAFQMGGTWYVIPVAADRNAKVSVPVTLEGPPTAHAKLKKSGVGGGPVDSGGGAVRGIPTPRGQVIGL